MQTAKEENKVTITLLNNLNNARKKNDGCDFTLKSKDGIDIPVHKFVLSSASSFFANMFDSGMKEANENFVVLEKFTGENLEKVINYIYTEGDEIELTQENAKEILDMALFFNLTNLKKISTKFLIKLLTINNFDDLLEYGITLIDDDLPKACCEWILKNSDSIRFYSNSSLNKISFECMQFLVKINMNERTTDIEELLYQIVIDWIKYDLETRQGHIKYLIEHLNYENMSKEFLLTDVVMENEILMEDKSFISKMLAFTKESLKKEEKCVFSILLCPNQNIFALTNRNIFEIKINGEENEKLSYVNSLCFAKDLARVNFDYTTCGRKNIFVCGGTVYSQGSNIYATSSCKFYSFETNSWTELSPPASSTGKITELDNKIYHMYCNTSNGYCYYQYFDSSTGNWNSSIQCGFYDMPRKMCSLHGVLYTLFESSLKRYIPSSNIWEHLSAFKNNNFSEVVEDGDYLYCFNKKGCCMFDIRMNRWLHDIILYEKNVKNTERNCFYNTGQCVYDSVNNSWLIELKNYSKSFDWDVLNGPKACLVNDEIYISDGYQIQIYKTRDFSFCRQFSILIPGLEGLVALLE